MAPYLEEPVGAAHESVIRALEAPLKSTPKLVAPEPGMPQPYQAHGTQTDPPKSIALVPSLSKLDKVTLAMDVQISQYALLHRKDRTLTSPPLQRALPAYGTKSSSSQAKEVWANPPSPPFYLTPLPPIRILRWPSWTPTYAGLRSPK